MAAAVSGRLDHLIEVEASEGLAVQHVHSVAHLQTRQRASVAHESCHEGAVVRAFPDAVIRNLYSERFAHWHIHLMRVCELRSPIQQAFPMRARAPANTQTRDT